MPATAEARKPPRIQMDHVKHLAWDLRQDYLDANVPLQEYVVGGDSSKCKRIKRNVIDCKTIVESGSGFEDDCVEAPGAPGDEHCEPGRRQETSAPTKIVSCAMRYRVDWKRRYVVINYYFIGDRYASIDTTSNRFGGRALRVRFRNEVSSLATRLSAHEASS